MHLLSSPIHICFQGSFIPSSPSIFLMLGSSIAGLYYHRLISFMLLAAEGGTLFSWEFAGSNSSSRSLHLVVNALDRKSWQYYECIVIFHLHSFDHPHRYFCSSAITSIYGDLNLLCSRLILYLFNLLPQLYFFSVSKYIACLNRT